VAEGTTSPSSLRFYGTVQPTANFQITMPVAARKDLGMSSGEPWFVFGSPDDRRAILTPSPAASELLDLLGSTHEQTRAGRESDEDGGARSGRRSDDVTA
jgi:bifunctional DNA-binding transcriptional regulator/antitoxin component of YhaV-PrlF toxin-antitoxin module